jgi:peptidyl-prolyl cis-trans isomerase D
LEVAADAVRFFLDPTYAGYFAMFDVVRNNKRIVQFFLILLVIPFAFFGVDFLRGGGAVHVAKVGEGRVLLAQFQEALRSQQKGVASSGVDTQAVLKDMVDYQLLVQEINRQRLLVDKATLRNVIYSIPYFHEKGVFSEARYKAVLEREQITPEAYEASLRQKIQFQFLVDTLRESAFVPKTVASREADLLLEIRDVQEFLIPWGNFASQVKLEADAAQKFYDENLDRFKQPELARVEYVVLENSPEERRASHILLSTGGADKAGVKAEAERLLLEVKKAPDQFAELAKAHSQDPGSAANGGDLGFFVREMMVKPFADAVFSMREGELSGLVETDYGFHIIKVTGIKPGRFGSRSFAEVEEEFSDLVFNDQPDSLKPVADKYNLTVYQSGWLPRQAGDAPSGVFDNPELREAVFSDDVIKNGHNSKAVQVAPNLMVSARLLEYQPASQRPFDAVKDEIEARLKQERATALAIEQGKTRLSELRDDKDNKVKGIRWGATRSVSRIDSGSLENAAAVPAIFKTDVKTLPAYVGVEAPGVGYVLYRINKVTHNQMEEAQFKAFSQQDLARIVGVAQVNAYVNALRQRYKVEINTAALERKGE